MLPWLTIIQGDALEKLRELPSESVQSCVTSPPYWGLRDYGTATWEGGDGDCDHRRPATGGNPTQGPNKGNNNAEGLPFRESCGKCGAKRIDAQIGLEETPEQYVTKMVEVFREVRRVIKKDGTCWVNLGDSYAGNNSSNGEGEDRNLRTDKFHGESHLNQRRTIGNHGLKPKDLCGIPWRVAFALQADGWYLRSDIIWHKPNPMPESVTDRPTKAHEYLFLLSKSERYYYNAEAIKEPYPYNTNSHMMSGRTFLANPREKRRVDIVTGDPPLSPLRARPPLISYTDSTPLEHNKRSVWTVPTEPYPEAHFATYPSDLIKPCILASTKNGDTVLDPFAGSGTTGMVAIELARKALLIELNPNYIELIETRCTTTPGLPL
jgi:DNA modification methylase